MYIVMLPHLSDISKIEVQAKDRYKLKVNTSKTEKMRRYITMFGKPFALVLWTTVVVFVQEKVRTNLES